MDKLLKVRCISTAPIRRDRKWDHDSNLILNKIYLVESTGFGSATSLFQTYRVYDENKNYLGLSREDNFITFEDWRDSQLNKIIN